MEYFFCCLHIFCTILLGSYKVGPLQCKKSATNLSQIFGVIENLHTSGTLWLVLSVYRVRLSLEETNICCLNFSRNAISFNCLSCYITLVRYGEADCSIKYNSNIQTFVQQFKYKRIFHNSNFQVFF